MLQTLLIQTLISLIGNTASAGLSKINNLFKGTKTMFEPFKGVFSKHKTKILTISAVVACIASYLAGGDTSIVDLLNGIQEVIAAFNQAEVAETAVNM